MDSPKNDLTAGQEKAYESFVRLLARAEPALRSFLRALVPTRDDVDEVLQQTSVVLWRKYGEFEPGSDFLSWARTIARYEVLKYRRVKARDRLMFSEELLVLLADEAAAESARLAQERRALDACVERLPVRQRELIGLCYGGGRTIKQVAELVGQSATGLYKALARIRAALLVCIERALAEEIAP